MRITSNLQQPDVPFAQPGRFIVALDVEWTKNYRIKNGSRPFCYSLVFLPWPAADTPMRFPGTFGFKSVYVSDADDEPALIVELDKDLRGWLASTSILAGHQLSSDLSVVKAAASLQQVPGVNGAYELWRTRKQGIGRIIDTRYDSDHLLQGASRRLVDVCLELELDVTQPELAKGSMTKLQNNFLQNRHEAVREQLLTLNIRHSLSTAVVACVGLGLLKATRQNINDLLHQELRSSVEYIADTQFQALLSAKPATLSASGV